MAAMPMTNDDEMKNEPTAAAAAHPPLESMVRAQQLIGTLHSLANSLDALTAGVAVPGGADDSSFYPSGLRPSLVASLSAQEREGLLAKLRQGLVTETEVQRYYSSMVDARNAEALYPSALAVPPTRAELEQTCGRFRSNKDRIDEVAGAGAAATRGASCSALARDHSLLEVSALLSPLSGSDQLHHGGSSSSSYSPHRAQRDSVSVTRVVREYEEKLVVTAKNSSEEGFRRGFAEGQQAASEQIGGLEAEVRFLKDKLRVHEHLARSCFKQKEATDGKMAFARDQRVLAESKLSRLCDVEQLRAENSALRYERDVFYAAAVKAHAPHTAELERMLAALHRHMMELFDKPSYAY